MRRKSDYRIERFRMDGKWHYQRHLSWLIMSLRLLQGEYLCGRRSSPRHMMKNRGNCIILPPEPKGFLASTKGHTPHGTLDKSLREMDNIKSGYEVAIGSATKDVLEQMSASKIKRKRAVPFAGYCTIEIHSLQREMTSAISCDPSRFGLSKPNAFS